MNHDKSYKLLFFHAEMVRDLLQSFATEDWVKQCDFSILEKVSGSYVSDDWLYVYLLLEFQSSIDYYMVVRILAYVALLYQDLIKSGQANPYQRLPPVLPIVLYNGQTRWQAPVDLVQLIQQAPPGLTAYRPTIRYLLILKA